MTRRFHKMHGLGNDFVVIDARAQPVAMTEPLAKALADRRTGIGCDQLILVGDDDAADVAMRIWNADGSEVEACGNATRCVARLVGRDCTIATPGGVLRATIEDGGASVDMGVPRFAWDAIPLAYPMDTAALPVAWEGLAEGKAVNVGNPHLVFFVPDAHAVPLDRIGPLIENDPLFPQRVNVSVAAVRDRGHVVMRTWERGAGLTRACGTGACAVFACGRRAGLVDDTVEIALPGGLLRLSESGDHLVMAGPASLVFTGEIDLEAFL